MNKIERVARAMAIADGLDPDAEAQGGPNAFKLQAKDFNGYALACRGPNWKTYQRQANLILAALSSLDDLSE